MREYFPNKSFNLTFQSQSSEKLRKKISSLYLLLDLRLLLVAYTVFKGLGLTFMFILLLHCDGMMALLACRSSDTISALIIRARNPWLTVTTSSIQLFRWAPAWELSQQTPPRQWVSGPAAWQQPTLGQHQPASHQQDNTQHHLLQVLPLLGQEVQGLYLHGLPACGLNLSLSSHRAYKTQRTQTRLHEKACRRSTGGGLRTNQRPRRPEIQGGVTAGQPMRGRVLKAETSGRQSIIISLGELYYWAWQTKTMIRTATNTESLLTRNSK